MRNVIVAGSRGFSDVAFAYSVLDALFGVDIASIISGGACGADSIGEKWAHMRNINVHRCPPNYEEHGKSAPLIRNQVMADIGDALVLFWDGKSRGSKDMLTRAYNGGIEEIHIYRYKK